MKTISLMFLGFFMASGIAQAAYQTIFTLERTMNKNQVVYEADLTNPLEPVHVYWVMNASDGHHEELTRLERSRAYGVEVLSQKQNEVKFVIKAFRSHPITVKKDTNGTLFATIKINNEVKILKNIFLYLTGGLIPGVSKIDIYYQNAKEGPVLRETFNPNE